MKYLLIMNPGSRGGKSKRKFKRILKLMDQHYLQYDVKYTKTLLDAYHFSIDGHDAGYDGIVAVGGDGTINKVLNGFYNEAGMVRSDAAMGVIYTGTSPDFCKNYNIPLELEDAVALIAKKQTRKIKIGMISHAKIVDWHYNERFIDDLEEMKVSYFGCCANIGIGADIARRANSGIRKITGDFLGTLFSTLRAIHTYIPVRLKTVIDGEVVYLEDVANLSIGMSHYIASGIKVPHTLTDDDEKMYIMTAQKMSFSKWFKSLKKVYSGAEFESDSFLSLRYCKSIYIAGNNWASEIEFDGDPGGYIPCLVELATDRLTIFAP